MAGTTTSSTRWHTVVPTALRQLTFVREARPATAPTQHALPLDLLSSLASAAF